MTDAPESLWGQRFRALRTGWAVCTLLAVGIAGCKQKDPAPIPTTAATTGPLASADAAGKEADQFLSSLEGMPIAQRQAYSQAHAEIVQRITTGTDTARMNRLIKLMTGK